MKLSQQSSRNKITSGQCKQGGTIQTQQSIESPHQVIKAPPTHTSQKSQEDTEEHAKKKTE